VTVCTLHWILLKQFSTGHVGCTEEIRRATEFYLENLKGKDHFGNIFEYSRMNYIYKPN